MKNIIEIKLDNGDNVHLKKDSLGYRVVEPPTKWYHYIYGSKRNLVTLILEIALLLFIIWAYHHDVTVIKAIYGNMTSDPIAWCHGICGGSTFTYPTFNFSGINITPNG